MRVAGCLVTEVTSATMHDPPDSSHWSRARSVDLFICPSVTEESILGHMKLGWCHAGASRAAYAAASRNVWAIGAATRPPTPPPSTITEKARSFRKPMNQAWVLGGTAVPNSAVPVLPAIG